MNEKTQTDKEFFRGTFVWLMKAINILPTFFSQDKTTALAAQIAAMTYLQRYFTGENGVLNLVRADSEIRNLGRIVTKNKILSNDRARKFTGHLSTSTDMIRLIVNPKIREEAGEMFFLGLTHPYEFKGAFHNGHEEITKWLNYAAIREELEKLKKEIG